MCPKGDSTVAATPAGPAKARTHTSVVYDILRTASYLRRAFADIFEQRGITFQQYNVVRFLRGAGPSGLPMLEIAQRMIARFAFLYRGGF